MKASPTKLFAVALAVVVLAGLLWIWLDYRRRAEPLDAQIERVRGFIDDARAESRQHIDVLERIGAVADRTLGAGREAVDHELRTRLNRIGEAVGLKGLSVNTTRYVAKGTPARVEFSSVAERSVRDEMDFVEAGGSVTGEGTLEQVLRLVHRVQSEPWPKRIDGLRLDPKDNGTRFDVTMRLTTLFMPNRAPEGPPAPIDLPAPVDDERFARYLALAEANPFRIPPAPPPPAAVEVAAAPEVAPPPPPFPYGQWSVTGVVEGPSGAEVWLLNRESGERRRLVAGDRFHGIELLSASIDEARFEHGVDRFRVRVGEALPSWPVE